jgi:hypothetical protein
MSRYLITTTASIQTCVRCGRLVLDGWSEGLRARVDPHPVDEAKARTAGFETYSIRGGALHWRDPTITYGPTTAPILSTHDCPNSRQGALW